MEERARREISKVAVNHIGLQMTEYSRSFDRYWSDLETQQEIINEFQEA